MKASVIIPHRDRLDHLKIVIDAILDQNIDLYSYEVIVVDDGSRGPIGHCFPPVVNWVSIPHQGAAAARNRGVALARGEVVIFLDCDIAVGRSFVQSHIQAHNANSQMVAIGPRWHMDISGKVKAFDTRLKLLNRYGKEVSELRHPWFMVYTCNVSVPRRLALQEPFDEHYKAWGLEDSEWAYRLYCRGCSFCFMKSIESVHLYHDRTMTCEKFLGWKTNLAHTLGKHPNLKVLECFTDVFDPEKKSDYFQAYDRFEDVLCEIS
jgi:glycosyltransferase involved in cell wall biosynthesis